MYSLNRFNLHSRLVLSQYDQNIHGYFVYNFSPSCREVIELRINSSTQTANIESTTHAMKNLYIWVILYTIETYITYSSILLHERAMYIGIARTIEPSSQQKKNKQNRCEI